MNEYGYLLLIAREWDILGIGLYAKTKTWETRDRSFRL